MHFPINRNKGKGKSMKKSDKLKQLEKRFNIAAEVVAEMVGDVEELEEDLTTELAISDHQLLPATIPDNIPEGQVFSIELLKQDFFSMRQNIQSLIAIGQNILRQASVLDLADMKASQLDALTSLQATLGGNMKLLIDLYKQIIDIEKGRAALHGNFREDGGTVVKGNMTQQNIIVGGTHDMLKLLDQANEAIEVNANGQTPDSTRSRH